MGSGSRRSASIVEGIVIFCVAITAALAGWRIVESRRDGQVAQAETERGDDCREAERYCSSNCPVDAEDCLESCMQEFGCVMHL